MNKKIKKKIDGALTVGDVIAALKELPEDMPIGSHGHFGEIELFRKSDLPDKFKGYVTASISWRDDNREYIEAVQLPSYDHGPDPD